MRNHTTHTRDAALRRLSHINRWLVAGSVVLTGVLADVAASAFPGKNQGELLELGHEAQLGPHQRQQKQPLQTQAVAAIQHQLQRRIRLRHHGSKQLLERRIVGWQHLGQRLLRQRIRFERVLRILRLLRVELRIVLELRRLLRRIVRGCHIGGVLEVLVTDASTSRRAPVGASWRALGTTIALRVGEPGALERAESAVRRELDAIDRTCSRFREDSELTALNGRAGATTRVSPLLREALDVALRAAALTDGDVDPTIGRALELAGYDRDFELLDRDAAGEPHAAPGQRIPRVRVRSLPGWRAVRLVVQTGSVRLPSGVSIDLGASAKAWAADRAAAAAARECECGVLVGVGGDIAAHGHAPAGGWQVFVTDDHRDGLSAPGQMVTIRSGGLATSSTAVRRWNRGGRAMHHIIDPSSGEPVRGTWRTVSVAAGCCADANTAATAAIVRAAEAVPWLTRLGLPSRLVGWDGSVTKVAGWPL